MKCFKRDGKDGYNPYAGLIFDAAGNLYGTTQRQIVGSELSGTVFELTPGANGTWTETVLHNFGGGADGRDPDAGLILDAAGNLYGTTKSGGIYGGGTVFELTSGAGGTWSENVLNNFVYNGENGYGPRARLLFDATGNLYGTTSGGGYGRGHGTVFQLVPQANGTWAENVLYRFCSMKGCLDGAVPDAGLIFDTVGNLYGTTHAGGAYAEGTVFQLAPGTNGTWTETVLHSFNNNGEDGSSPNAAVIFDAAGNLFGTTYLGGSARRIFK